jgi:outer membrane protein assembly factor BamB
MAEEIRGASPLMDRPPSPAGDGLAPSAGPAIRPPAPPKSVVRRLRFPLIVAAVTALLYFSVDVWALGWGAAEREPPAIMWFGLVSFFSMVLGALVLTVWWLFFSRTPWALRLGVFAVLIALGAGWRACVRPGEFLGMKAEMHMPYPNVLRPKFYMIWDELPEERRARHQSGPADGLESINLTVGPEDFARFRGPNADGVSYGPALATDWKAQSPRVLWNQPSGGGYSGFAVAGNVAVTVEQLPGKEAVVCYDRATGRERWKYEYAAHRGDAMGDGPRATPLIADGKVYSLGATGELVCVDGATGAKVWQTNILTDCGARNMQWGLSGSPLLVDDLIIVNPGIDSEARPENRANMALAAYSRDKGKRVWAKGKRGTGYCSPELAKLGGREQILLFDAGGLSGVNPKTGDELWFYEWTTYSDMNTAQPLVIGDDRVFITSEASPGCAVVKVTASDGGKKWEVEEVWRHKRFGAKYANPVVKDGYIYGLSNGFLVCLDAATGAVKWEKIDGVGDKGYGVGQVLLRGDVLVVLTAFGEVRLVAADPSAPRTLARFAVFDKKKTWNTHALAGDQLFVRNQKDMACLQLPLAAGRKD